MSNNSTSHAILNFPNYTVSSYAQSLGILFAFTSFMTIFLNGVVLITLYKYAVLHTNSNKILASLATTDFLTGAIAPIYTILIFDRQLIYGNAEHLLVALSHGLILVSALTMAFISIDRYMHITKLTNYQLQDRTSYVGILVCWAIPGVTTAVGRIFNEIGDILFTIEMTFAFLVIVGFYTDLIRAVHKYTREHSHELNDNYVKNERRGAHTIIIIATCFILMNFMIVFGPFLTYTIDRNITKPLFHFAFFLCISNSVVNPLVYSFRTQVLKEHILK